MGMRIATVVYITFPIGRNARIRRDIAPVMIHTGENIATQKWSN